MEIKKNQLLAPYTTFKIGGPARFFCVVRDQFDALEAYEFAREKKLKTFVLGGGSNILISDKGFDGLVIRVVNKGIEVIDNNNNDGGVLLKVASGEVWDEVVSFAVTNGWWGIENLSHIPGSTGAIAVQNVGAYGQEASAVIESVTVFDKETRQILNLADKDCGFAYRQSIFNTSQKGKYIIFYISLRLQQNGKPNLSYRDLALKFSGKNPELDGIRRAVIEIRDKKFPFPVEATNGNAGSFFKNPVLTDRQYGKLAEMILSNFGEETVNALETKKFSGNSWSTDLTAANFVRREDKSASVKIPAAFLVELCGLKDLKIRGAAINQNQPLVIINQSGTATAEDVLRLADQVKQSVLEKTGIALNFEPELVGF